jgi:hypothetical protein
MISANHIDKKIVVLWLRFIVSIGPFWLPWHALENFKLGKINVRGWVYRDQNPNRYWYLFSTILIIFIPMGIFVLFIGINFALSS